MDVFELYAQYDGYPAGSGWQWAFEHLPHRRVVRMMAQDAAVTYLSTGALADSLTGDTKQDFERVIRPLIEGFEAFIDEEPDPPRFAPRPQSYANFDFPSASEARIAQALDRAAESSVVAWFSNPKGRFGSAGARENRKPDFLVFAGDEVGVLEVDGPYHDATADALRDELFASHGFRVMRVSAGECFENPDGVVAAFLDWLNPAL